jgi:superfamily II DNA/RNA helicase
MKFADQSTNLDRFDSSVRPLIRGMLQNRRIMGEGHEDPPLVTEAIKYTSQPQYRRQTTTYDGSNQDINRILDILPFDEPLEFQLRSWETVTELLRKQSITGQSYATLFSAPTGIGKTECFLGPVLQQCLDGTLNHALIVYPRQSLLQDQFQRILGHLHDIDESSKFGHLSVGLWYGATPRNKNDVQTSHRLSNEQDIFKLTECWCEEEDGTHRPLFLNAGQDWYNIRCPEGHQYKDEQDVVLHKQGIRYSTPDIVLTTLESLELFSLKPNYDLIEKFDTIIFDELHLFNGTYGAHAAKVIENIREIVPSSHLFMGSSATLENPDLFCRKMFGLTESNVEVIEPDPEVDYVETDDREHYYFVLSDDNVSLASTYIEQLLLLSHSFLEDEYGLRKTILSFIDSVSQVNQKETQFYDADARRQLWRHHEEAPEVWPEIASQTGHKYIDEPISTTKAFSDSAVRSDQLSTADLIFSTSFLEVGIDIPDIHVVTQYRAPWNLSSFVQRSGRAARSEGTDSHIVTFLSQQTGDHNLFYRADRFLDSEVATPLNTDNQIVNWIHDQYLSYYEVADRVLNEHPDSQEERRTRAFLQRFLIEELNFGAFHNFLLDPKSVLAEYSDEYPTNDLLDPSYIETATSGLEARKEEISTTMAPVAEFLSTDTDELLLQDNALQQFLDELRDSALSVLSEFEAHLAQLDAQTDDDVTEIEETIASVKSDLEAHPDDIDTEVETFVEITGTLQQLQGQLTTVGGLGTGNIGVGGKKLGDLQTAVESLVTLVQQGDFAEQQRERKEIYYLRNCLEEFQTFVTTPWGFASLYAVKHLLRAAYYFDKNRSVTQETDRTLYYVPENYFDSGGLSFTLIAGEEQSEQSIHSLTGKYAPYRYEYQESGEEIVVFQPEIKPTEDGYIFDYSSTVSGDIRDGVLIPSSVTAKRVKDVSGSEGMSIVAYRTKDYELLTDEDQSSASTEQALGKFHPTPRLASSVMDVTPVRDHDTLTLANVTGKVTLESVDLEITPARYVGHGYSFTGSKETISVESPDPPLGFVLDTRAVIWDVSTLVETLLGDDAVIEALERYKTLDEVHKDEVILYTAAHYLLLMVADVSGASPGQLLYSIDQEQGQVAVFERSEGGQGVVDLLLETMDTSPAKLEASHDRVGYNPQIETERLWAEADFVRAVSDIAIEDRTGIEELVSEQLTFDIEDESRIVEEVISTLDKIADVAEQQELDYRRVCNIKHDIATLSIDGVSTIRGHIAGAYGEELSNIDQALELLASPDIDGCVENLHVPYPMTAEKQEEVVSYVVLERIRDAIF